MPEHIRQEPKVLVSTENLTEQEWLAHRRQGIGGSDVAAILGISPFRTARDLYDDKLNIASAADDTGNWVALEMGHLLEPLVAQIFTKKTGLEAFQIKKMFQHPQYPFMLADVDYFVRLPNGKIVLLEIKTTNYNAKDHWWKGGEECVPIYYETQGRHYMAVMDMDEIFYCCLYGNNEDEVIIRHLYREWVESKYGYQLQVEQWREIVPQTADGLLAYLGSGLIKGIGPKTAEDIVATFGPDTLNILDNEPEKLLQIRGITEGKLKDIEESYAESRVLRNLMSLLGPFKITPATALKIYQHFGSACVDILKKCPYDLCQISGFGFKRVDGIVRKTDNRLHSAERIKGAVLYTLEDARSKSGHLFLPAEDLTKETLLLLNAPIPIPEQRVRTEEVQEGCDPAH